MAVKSSVTSYHRVSTLFSVYKVCTQDGSTNESSLILLIGLSDVIWRRGPCWPSLCSYCTKGGTTNQYPNPPTPTPLSTMTLSCGEILKYWYPSILHLFRPIYRILKDPCNPNEILKTQLYIMNISCVEPVRPYRMRLWNLSKKP
jgi:hypothetical protein